MDRTKLMFMIFNMSLEKKLHDRQDLLKRIIEDFIVLETGSDREQRNEALSDLEKNLPLPVGIEFQTKSVIVENMRQIYWKCEYSNFWQFVISIPAAFDTYRTNKKICYVCRN
ncbi:MAG: hypothetical protein V1815_01915 [Candidatus Woesearchaeota archaeon]